MTWSEATIVLGIGLPYLSRLRQTAIKEGRFYPSTQSMRNLVDLIIDGKQEWIAHEQEKQAARVKRLSVWEANQS